ncbi:hypothetical protein Ahy_A07g031926 [Arachis hypogaea]|uniref:Aminotransferase-like plant mobile domain-containing protein n=1 Tax=Arachis hypogaea TaxID=3818 RepID=A0A445C5H8_ARAHY|nr:hypothetical protein Ahy_A07g031926 [Arachis hypogaea]
MTKPIGGNTDKQHIEGFRLSNYKPNFLNTQSDEDRLWAVFSLFHSYKDFENDQLNFTPFLRRNRGPAWLDRLLFPNTNEDSELVNRSWTNLLAVQAAFTQKGKVQITLYAPHLTARQLGFSQAILTPQPRNNDPFCHIVLTTQEDFNTCLLKNQQLRDRFNFLIYERSSYITKSCFEWWAAYYSRYTRTLEEIQQTAIQTIPVAENLPKRTHKRKADTARPPPHKSRRTPTRTSRKLVLLSSSESSYESEPTNKDTLAASSQSEDTADSDLGPQPIWQQRLIIPFTAAHSITSSVVPDQPILEQHHDQGHSSSHDSIQATGSTQPLDAVFPPSHATLSVVNQVALDSDSTSQNVETTNSYSSRSRVLETPPKLPSPPRQVDFHTIPGPRPGTSNASTTPTSATLANLISVLNKVIQENAVPVPVPTLLKPATSRPSFELNTNTREQLRSLIKLLDHPPTTWVNDPILNQLLADLLNSSFELPANTPNSALIQEFKELLNERVASQFQLQETETEETKIKSNIESCFAAAQPIQASREEFDMRISHAISVQAFHDKEEEKPEAELGRINEKLAIVRQSRATIAKPLADAQQEQQHLFQKLISFDTKQEEYETQLEKVQFNKFKQIEALSILEKKRAKLHADLAKLVAP